LTKKTIHIFFIILGILITSISIKYYLIIPIFIGLIVLIQGFYGFIKDQKK